MSTSARRSWVRCVDGRGPQCPVCGHTGGCLIASDGSAAVCMRVQDGCAKRGDGSSITAKGGMGWVHRLDDRKRRGIAGKLPAAAAQGPRLTVQELKAMLKEHRGNMTPKLWEQCCKGLGLNRQAVEKYVGGYDIATGCFSFPMFDGERKLVGIRLRGDDGRKLCVRGSRNGLFVASDYDPQPIPVGSDPTPLVLVLPEGPTDAAAARQAGFQAIGRPSDKGGVQELAVLLRSLPKQDVVVVADNDTAKYRPDGTAWFPGIEGALTLSAAILPHCGHLRFIIPNKPHKDLRDWFKAEGRAPIWEAVFMARAIDAEWIAAAQRKYQAKCDAARRKAG